MGEIDRIHSVFRPVFGPKPTDRVQPDADRQHHPHQDQDELDLSNLHTPEEPEEAEERPVPTQRVLGEGLDISI
ncbi:MAG TPA: hypothetical protein VHE55_05395 [Fimbriimonadaceae bacterium]|nr:hypothetical protein [Fimbriimonadaceae bacterium]